MKFITDNINYFISIRFVKKIVKLVHFYRKEIYLKLCLLSENDDNVMSVMIKDGNSKYQQFGVQFSI